MDVVQRIYGIASSRLYQPSKPQKDPAYLRWLRTRPCCVCGTEIYVCAAHTGGKGLSQKSGDHKAVPLCESCHLTGDDCYHQKARRFFAERDIDVDTLIRRLRAEYLAQTGKDVDRSAEAASQESSTRASKRPRRTR
jgi:hypothetical protein